MFRPFDWLAYQVTRHPGVVAGVALVVFIVALYGTTLITMQTGNEAYLDKNTPRGALLAHYADTYGSDAIMVIIESDDVTRVDTLWYIDGLLSHIQNQQSVERTSGIGTLLKQGNNGTVALFYYGRDEKPESFPAALLKKLDLDSGRLRAFVSDKIKLITGDKPDQNKNEPHRD